MSLEDDRRALAELDDKAASRWNSEAVSDWLLDDKIIVIQESEGSELCKDDDDEIHYTSDIEPVTLWELEDAGFIRRLGVVRRVTVQTTYEVTDRFRAVIEDRANQERIAQLEAELRRLKGEG